MLFYQPNYLIKHFSNLALRSHRSLNKPSCLQTPVAGWLQAFAAHPRIGDMESMKKKFDAFTSFSQGEQATAAASASDATLQSLADWNVKYEAKFGHIFIICAAGKSADFMLDAVKTR
jgi:2-oxo-4-hydroxy-4-carboxy--5-ureidoimidazoline (OHCU) decarboxylase